MSLKSSLCSFFNSPKIEIKLWIIFLLIFVITILQFSDFYKEILLAFSFLSGSKDQKTISIHFCFTCSRSCSIIICNNYITVLRLILDVNQCFLDL